MKWRPRTQAEKDDIWNAAQYGGKRRSPLFRFALISGRKFVIVILFVLLVIVVGVNWFFPVVGKSALTGYLIACIGKIIIALGCFYIFLLLLIKLIKERSSQRTPSRQPWFKYWITIIICIILPLIGISQSMQTAVGIEDYRIDSRQEPVQREVDCIAIQQSPSRLRVFHYRKPHLLLKADDGEPFLAEVDPRVARSIQNQIRHGLLHRGQNGYVRIAIEYYPASHILYSIDYPGNEFIQVR
ncbi:MAG TPA: hypothetical protein GX717_04490 [Clostridiaceae bacterium]|nr:hypothetical protein [Clostridiaceae bacterium]